MCAPALAQPPFGLSGAAGQVLPILQNQNNCRASEAGWGGSRDSWAPQFFIWRRGEPALFKHT